MRAPAPSSRTPDPAFYPESLRPSASLTDGAVPGNACVRSPRRLADSSSPQPGQRPTRLYLRAGHVALEGHRIRTRRALAQSASSPESVPPLGSDQDAPLGRTRQVGSAFPWALLDRPIHSPRRTADARLMRTSTGIQQYGQNEGGPGPLDAYPRAVAVPCEIDRRASRAPRFPYSG